MLRHIFPVVLLVAAVVTMGGNADAKGRILYADLMKGARIRIDGMLREWPQGVMRLGYRLRGEGSRGDPRVLSMIGYDDRQVYVALKVWDEKLVRTRGYGKTEDHAVLTMAFPAGGGRYTTEEVLLYAGQPGKTPGMVKRAGGGKVAGSKLVEAPMEGGYTLEAQIPWSTFRSARRWRVGLRGAIRYVDVDVPGKVAAVVGTSEETSGKALPRLLLESERTLEESIRSNHLKGPDYELYGDVAGDAQMERVAVYDNYLTIVGAGYMEGKQYFYADLGVPDESWITRFELKDADGDGKDDIILQKRVGGADTYREVLIAQKIGADGSPQSIFLHDVAIVTPDAYIKNDVKLSRGRRGLAITISRGKDEWSDRSVFEGAVQEDIPHALLPWETVGSCTYEWDGEKFVKTGERKARAAAPKKGKPRPRREGPPAPPPPRPPTSEELLDKVYALYRKERGVKKAEPRFDFVTDVAEDEQMERVLVHERDIVVFGRGFLGGTTFTYTTMGFAEPGDVLHVTARDLTGDGKAEIMARGVLHADGGEELGGARVDRYVLFVYKVIGDRMLRVFAAETGRALGDNRILAGIAFVPSAKGLSIELRPGRAVGWTKQTYPFPVDTESQAGLEPLILPWSGSTHGYAFDGSAFSAE
jgi:hypothetical protein